MPATIVQQKTGVLGTASSSTTISFDGAVSAGNEIIILYSGAGSVASGSIPAGFAEPPGVRQDTYHSHYLSAVAGHLPICLSLSIRITFIGFHYKDKVVI